MTFVAPQTRDAVLAGFVRHLADRGRVALQRGPIVYAAEWPDNPNGKTRNIVLPDDRTLTTEFRADLLNGVQVTDFTGTDPSRGQPSTPAAPAYAGLQIHPGSRMAFRNIEYRAI